MGFNTTVLILNDGLHELEKHPKEFVESLVQAIQSGKFPATIGVGSHCNPVTVIECHHADYDVLVKIGGNRGEVVLNGKEKS